jgi:hydrogenase maturation protease
MNAPVRVIGVGSPFGGDDVGFAVIELLRRSDAAGDWGSQVDLLSADRPGVGLIEIMRGARCVVLVDALLSGDTPGRVRRLQGPELACAATRWSSHGIGVVEALALARALDCLPERLILFGIAVGSSGDKLPETALPAAVDAIRAEVAALLRDLYVIEQWALPRICQTEVSE